ncbi:MAG: hypothetical protein JW939_04555, partial [Candidatus Thermoplasmatota archaeon]|nr:hypothetical protein [Candidatus Thermoplasmatota archaeon]
RYRSPDITGSLRVAVVDANMNPVDGARVLVMSHWVTEQISTGPYQGPLPTVPLPAIWGYTDHYGICDLNVWRQNINIMVTSDLGTYVSGKFSVPETGGVYNMFVRLQGSKPFMQRYYPDPEVPDNGTRYLFSFEVEGSYQLQRDLYSGVLFRNEMSNGAVALRMYQGGYDLGSLILDGDLIEGGAYTQEMRDGNDNILISLSDLNSFKEHTRVRVKVWKVEEVEGRDAPDMVLANGNGLRNEGIDNDAEYPVTGWMVSSNKAYLDEIETISVQGPLGDFPFDIVRDHPLNYDKEWSLRIGARRILGVPGKVNGFIVNVYNETATPISEPINTYTWEPYVKNARGPEWMQLTVQGYLNWGSKADLGASYNDPYGGFRGIGWIDGQQVWDRSSIETEWHNHTISQLIDTAEYNSGNHRIAMTAIDPCGSLQPVMYSLRFLPNPPTLNVTSPLEGEDLYSNEITVTGDVSDDVGIISLRVRINEEVWDITDTIREDGYYEMMIRFKGDPGIYSVEVNATDNVGLWTAKVVNITLKALPDEIDPTIIIESPGDGSRFEKGEVITFRGTAYDLSGLSKLQLTANGRTHDILEYVIGGTFSYPVDTSSWSTGEKKVTLSGTDMSQNTALDSIHVELYEVVEEFNDRETPSIMIDNPTAGMPIAIGTVFHLSGSIFDDGPDITFELSIDRGETYEDLTSVLEGAWEFDLEIDTLDIVSGSVLDPDPLRTVLENYPLILRVEDGAGRQVVMEHYLNLIDPDPPSVRITMVEFDTGSDTIFVDVITSDLTPIRSVNVEIISPDGETIRSIQLYHNVLRTEEGRTTGSASFTGPFVPGVYKISVTASDTWNNRAEASVDLDIETQDREEERTNPLIFVLISFIGLVLLAIIVYGLVRAFRRGNP